jgi:hypothetical protein
MVRMAQLLKSNTLAFGDILKKDDKVLNETHHIMATNQSRLKKELERLRIVTSRYGTTCWMQILLTLVVVIVFVWMYLFMKLFPKKTRLAEVADMSMATPSSVMPLTSSLTVVMSRHQTVHATAYPTPTTVAVVATKGINKNAVKHDEL